MIEYLDSYIAFQKRVNNYAIRDPHNWEIVTRDIITRRLKGETYTSIGDSWLRGRQAMKNRFDKFTRYVAWKKGCKR